MNGKNIILALVALALLGAIGYLLYSGSTTTVVPEPETTEPTEDQIPAEPDEGIGDGAEPLDEIQEADEASRGDTTTIGTSVNGTAITAYHFGSGSNELLLVGGVHGSYAPNTSELGEELIAYFTDNEDAIPADTMVTVIPRLNPDGLAIGGTTGRFNANEVDLNRNFACEWSADAVWRNQPVDAGDAAFSEPEAVALRDYVTQYEPSAAVVWFAAEGKVYPSACATTPSRTSVELAANFATAAGYPAEAEFDAYAITGDMVNWMADQGIPAISVLLSNYEDTEWLKNQAGVEAVLNTLAE